jgi:hypothetical protein
LVDEKGFEPSASSLRTQTAKLDGATPDEKEKDGKKGLAESTLSE